MEDLTRKAVGSVYREVLRFQTRFFLIFRLSYISLIVENGPNSQKREAHLPKPGIEGISGTFALG